METPYVLLIAGVLAIIILLVLLHRRDQKIRRNIWEWEKKNTEFLASLIPRQPPEISEDTEAVIL